MKPKVRDFLFGLILSIILNAILSAFAPGVFGGRLTLEGWAMGWIVCTIVSVILSAILPMHKISVAFTRGLGATEASCAERLLGNVLMATIFAVFLVFTMVALSTGFGTLGETTFLDRYLNGLISIWPIVVVCLIFSAFLAHSILNLFDKPEK